jgi:hypothetical protein
MFKRIIFVLFATSLCSATGAEELADPKGSYAICAASNAITASRMEPAILADAMKVVAQHNAATARELGATIMTLSNFDAQCSKHIMMVS